MMKRHVYLLIHSLWPFIDLQTHMSLRPEKVRYFVTQNENMSILRNKVRRHTWSFGHCCSHAVNAIVGRTQKTASTFFIRCSCIFYCCAICLLYLLTISASSLTHFPCSSLFVCMRTLFFHSSILIVNWNKDQLKCKQPLSLLCIK